MRKFIILLILIVTTSYNLCDAQRLPEGYIPFGHVDKKTKRAARKVLSEILDAAGLYTILGDLKPASRIDVIYFNRFERRGLRFQERINKKTTYYQKVMDAISDSVLCFKFIASKGYRVIKKDTIQMDWMPYIIVMRRDLIQKIVTEKSMFFTKMGINANTSMDSIANFFSLDENKYRKKWGDEVLRVQGYLYGYPDYAVDFFMTKDNGKFQKVSVPIYDNRATEGFSYITPPGTSNANPDVLIMERAKAIMNKYIKLRKKHKTIWGYNSFSLVKDWYSGIK